MLKLALAFALLVTPAVAAELQNYTLTVTDAELQAIAQGLQELPYKTAAPLLLKLRDQIEAQTVPKSAPPAKH